MNEFPKKDEVIVHFAHPAYQFGSCLKSRDPRLNFIETRTHQETSSRINEGHVLVVTGLWQNAYIETGVNLKFIQACGAGYNQFDLDALATKGLRFANASGVNVNAVSDHAIALMLCLVRKIHHARDNQRAHHWRIMISEISQREAELAGKTLIIFGMGAIGGRLAKLAADRREPPPVVHARPVRVRAPQVLGAAVEAEAHRVGMAQHARDHERYPAVLVHHIDLGATV